MLYFAGGVVVFRLARKLFDPERRATGQRHRSSITYVRVIDNKYNNLDLKKFTPLH